MRTPKDQTRYQDDVVRGMAVEAFHTALGKIRRPLFDVGFIESSKIISRHGTKVTVTVTVIRD